MGASIEPTLRLIYDYGNMKKPSTIYRCSACGHEEPKWLGRCPECGQWNTMVEAKTIGRFEKDKTAFSVPLESVDPALGARVSSGISELDRVLGGGFMRGSAVLLGGEPGIGKSTLLLQACSKLGAKGKALYISGEESAAQIRLRAERIKALSKQIEIFCGNDMHACLSVMDSAHPLLTVVDSIQTVHSEEAGAVPGTPNQIKFCTQEFVEWAKSHDSIVVLVAHVTKDGMIAGPKAAEHLVDAVISFEQAENALRVLRTSKNRFGSSDELGFFLMSEGGLSELQDPSGIFMIRREGQLPSGIALAIVYEGSRILLAEVQALTIPSKSGIMRVYSDRIDPLRVSRIAAVLEKQTRLDFSSQEIYVNVAGGLRLTEPAVDLPLACALYSARSGQPLPEGSALAGELSLAGEIRPVRSMDRRTRAAHQLGFARIIGPKALPAGAEVPAKRGAAKAEVVGAEAAKSGTVRVEAAALSGQALPWLGASSLRESLRILWGQGT
ncbi:MAG TPA: DNA repair protein RadA [Rectinema sp.]|nr:DNA repair protein RadA [Rectinema sp.]HQJ21983.1 DNA repair protein RadA [Rectinema sp.]